ncbi:MAG: ImmA/IrrE family metallo-endopeptidase [Candidatus Paceibacterota bacterium]
MGRSITIEVEPLILKYARYCSGYDIQSASKKLKVSEDRLREFEDKKQAISLVQVKKMSAIYKMPVAYFLLINAPKDMVVPKDFRIIYASEAEKFSPEVMLAVRRARYIQSTIHDLKEEIQYNFKSFSLKDSPEQAADYFRSILNVSLAQQKKLDSPNLALRTWKDAVEGLGIFVLQQSLPKDDISAFSLADKKPYVVLLNSAEHENRRVFSLFHEIGHVLLHRSGICTPDNFSRNSYDYIQIEKFCNAFSSEVLVPARDFINNETVKLLSKQKFEDWNLDNIKSIASLYRVSQEVIYRKLVQVGILDEKKYEKRRQELLKGFEEYQKRKKGKIIIPQYRKIISKNGRAFVSVVLRNMYENRITIRDVSDFLGTTSRHIVDVEAHI